MIKTLSLEHDRRINGFCVTARASYAWFLERTEGSEENLRIQRNIIKGTKAYATLRADLKRGCVLPPLVLSAQKILLPQQISQFDTSIVLTPEVESVVLSELQPQFERLTSKDIQIIDGLQRTNAIRQTVSDLDEDEKRRFLDSVIRFEIWLNLPFNAIAYRMLLLNAGQKPMSMKHQVEVLSNSLRQDLSTIDGIEIFTASDKKRRTKPGQFHLADLSQAFQAWLQGSPNIDVSNIVMQELLAESAIETLGTSVKSDSISESRDSFRDFIKWMVRADQKIAECNNDSFGLQFFGSDPVLLGVAAVIGSAERNEVLSKTLWASLNGLLTALDINQEDPLGIKQFNDIRQGFNPSKRNVGVATRDLVFNAFQRYFIGNGSVPMNECWLFAGTASKA